MVLGQGSFGLGHGGEDEGRVSRREFNLFIKLFDPRGNRLEVHSIAKYLRHVTQQHQRRESKESACNHCKGNPSNRENRDEWSIPVLGKYQSRLVSSQGNIGILARFCVCCGTISINCFDCIPTLYLPAISGEDPTRGSCGFWFFSMSCVNMHCWHPCKLAITSALQRQAVSLLHPPMLCLAVPQAPTHYTAHEHFGVPGVSRPLTSVGTDLGSIASMSSGGRTWFPRMILKANAA